jgi:hypothetical protein
LFEMQMEQITTPNVRHTFYWGTHSPWNGESGDAPLATLFSNDEANQNHMQADVLSAINKNRVLKNIQISTQNTGSFNNFEKWVFAGKSEYDAGVEFKLESGGEFDEHSIETGLPPFSITILRLALNDDGGNTSLNSLINSKEIKVYPNPAKDMLNIEGAQTFGNNTAIGCLHHADY